MNIKEITDYIFINDINPKGDIAFVFGSSKTIEESINKVAEIYKNGLAPKIIVSGGKNRNTGFIEGDLMLKKLQGLGIPEEDILLENKSTNTLENVLFSKEVINQKLGLQNIKIIIAVVRNYHARRVLMTLRKYMPPYIQLKAVSYMSNHYPFTKDNWNQNETGKEKVMKELGNIKKYLEKGDIQEL